MSAILNSLKILTGTSRSGAGGDNNVKFSVTPASEEGDFEQWLHAMRLVARLPAGVPQHFRKKLWLTLAERYLNKRNVDWLKAEKTCFRGTQNQDDSQLGSQIVKDLHRTGCSLFCGAEGRENQAMLRRVLLAYARWNKEVGYCQGFNMLAAIILETMDKSESDALKVMIYLVEAVLPEGYFADDLRGLSTDMAAFRDLLRLRLPKLAQHMDKLQKASDGMEPPLCDVFTMQWFLTLYATWLPRPALLRVWDLIFLDGNEILLLTALAIWEHLQEAILRSRSADEFYSSMGGMGGMGDAVRSAADVIVCRAASTPLAPELRALRDHHRIHVAPIQHAVQAVTKKGLRLFYSEDEDESSDDGNKLALATLKSSTGIGIGKGGAERLSLDVGGLRRQYLRLRERQRQAHVILAAACARHASTVGISNPSSLTVNHLLLGKSAIVNSKGRRLGAPPGAVPPSRRNGKRNSNTSTDFEEISWLDERKKKDVSRRDSIKWKDIKTSRKTSIESDEGEGVYGTIVSQKEADKLALTVRSKQSDSSSYSSHSETSSDTSLCDDKESDGESDPCSLTEDFKKSEKSQNEDAVELDKVLTLSINQETRDNSSKESIFDTKSPLTFSLNTSPKPVQSTSCESIDNFVQTSKGESLKKYLNEFSFSEGISDTYPTTQLTEESVSKNTVIDLLSAKTSIKEFEHYLPTVRESADDNVIIFEKENCLSVSKNDHINVKFSESTHVSSRPPDIIDSLTKYPNFVPDIDLSDKYSYEIASPLRSPGAESITISEDEPPIPLNIDKYFEHSPEFFGARQVVKSDDEDIPNRRNPKRFSRSPKRYDQTFEYNGIENKNLNNESFNLFENHSDFSLESNENHIDVSGYLNKDIFKEEVSDRFGDLLKSGTHLIDKTIESGRRNSEKALEIIQENSKILNRILTKKASESISTTSTSTPQIVSNYRANDLIKSDEFLPVKESFTGSFDRFDLSQQKTTKFLEDDSKSPRFRRPISLDESSPIFKNSAYLTHGSFTFGKDKYFDNLAVNRVDNYGWENKGFSAENSGQENSIQLKLDDNCISDDNIFKYSTEFPTDKYDWTSSSNYLRVDTMTGNKNDNREENSDFDRSLSSERYLSRASDVSSTKTFEKGTKYYDKSYKDDSLQSDFAYVVTSSISVSYEPSVGIESPIGIKSDSSDTLCQVASLDQVSTPVSPPQDKIEKVKISTDSTCSAITSLIDTDTVSSVSLPRSPSSSSFHPFPTRPVLRTPKELGVRLGMYSRESIHSPSK